MVHTSTLTAAAAVLLLALPCSSAGLYSKNSPVIQVDGKSYDRLIARSNHTSLVEFYAPWCGHCKNLQPAFEKAAKSLAGLAKLAAVNCDEDANKQFCGSMGVKGFPTLKIVKPGKKLGTPTVEDYNGAREAKAIVEAMTGKIPNHVKKVTDKELQSFLAGGNSTAKAILFTEKGTVSPLIKALAIDFLGSITVAQIRNKETAAVEIFGITKFPSLVLLPGGDAQSILYDGEIKKDSIVSFFAQVAAPNPDPAPVKVKMPKKKADKEASKSFESASSLHQKEEASSAAAGAAEETLQEPSQPTQSPVPAEEPIVKPIVLPEGAPGIPTLATTEELVKACLGEKSGTCILALVPAVHDEAATKALSSLAAIALKHQVKRKIFPFYAVPDDNTDAATLKKSLLLSGDVSIIAINRKRGWFITYENKDLSLEGVETFVDQIRMGEGAKQKLPGGILGEKTGNAAAEAEVPLESSSATAHDEVVEETTEEPETEPTAVVVEESVVAEESTEPTVSVKDEL